MLVLFFDDLARDPVGFGERVLAFLGLRAGPLAGRSVPQENSYGRPRSGLPGTLLRSVDARLAARVFVPERFRPAFRRLLISKGRKQPPEADVERLLADFYRSDDRRLEELLGMTTPAVDRRTAMTRSTADGRLRVLVVTNIYPRLRAPFYGTFVHDEVTALREAGLDVDVLAVDGRRSRRAYAAAFPRLWRRLARRRYDLIHAHHAFAGVIARAQIGLPVVMTQHGLIGGRSIASAAPALRAAPTGARRACLRRRACPRRARRRPLRLGHPLRRRPLSVPPSRPQAGAGDVRAPPRSPSRVVRGGSRPGPRSASRSPAGPWIWPGDTFPTWNSSFRTTVRTPTCRRSWPLATFCSSRLRARGRRWS